MERNDITRVALTWAPEGIKKVGRPTENWRRTVEKERRKETNWDTEHGERQR